MYFKKTKSFMRTSLITVLIALNNRKRKAFKINSKNGILNQIKKTAL